MITVFQPAQLTTKTLTFSMSNSNDSDLFQQSLNYAPLLYLWRTNSATISGTTLDTSKDIIYLKLDNSKFIPEIEVYCTDSKGLIFNDFYPFDHDIILSVFIKSQNELTMPIRMDFRIIDHQSIKGDDDKFKFLLKGTLDIDNLHFTPYVAMSGTSYDVIKSISLEMGLGFASNIESSNDTMTWINPGIEQSEFIKEITKCSYIDDNSFVWTFIDFYYNLNYVDINKELNSINSSELSPSTNAQISDENKIENVPYYLSNLRSIKGTNQYITKFNIVNQSYKVNLDLSYQTFTTWYEKNNNTVSKVKITELETDGLRVGSNLVQLKDKNVTSNPVTPNLKIYEQNTNDEYFIGKMDTDNSHEKFLYSKTSNDYNLNSMEKIKMIVTLSQMNFSIKRFQTIKVEIYNYDEMFSYGSTDPNRNPMNFPNPKLSGYWFVTGINYIFTTKGGIEEEVTLMRRDLDLNYGDGSASTTKQQSPTSSSSEKSSSSASSTLNNKK